MNDETESLSPLVNRLRQADAVPDIFGLCREAADALESILKEVLTWGHHEDCRGQGFHPDDEGERVPCDCGNGAILAVLLPDREVYVDCDGETDLSEPETSKDSGS